jgi:acyl dehydratase
MPIPESIIGAELPTLTVTLEAGRLRFFAQAIGQTDPIYTDADAAKAAGHRDIVVSPTFLFGLEAEGPNGFTWLTDLGVDLAHVLHGEQSFTYHELAYAGQTVELRPRIVDVYTKKGGSLEFIRKHTAVVRDGSPIADLENVIVVRRPVVTA